MKMDTVDIRVRMSEVDRQGFAFHSRYFEWFSVGRIEYLRSVCGVTFASDARPMIGGQARNITFVIKTISCQFLSPARFDDVLELHTTVKNIKGTDVLLEHELYLKTNMKPLARAQCRWTCVSTKDFKPRKVPEDMSKIFQDP